MSKGKEKTLLQTSIKGSFTLEDNREYIFNFMYVLPH